MNGSNPPVPLFPLIKPVIDSADFEGLLETGCPADEYDIETRLIAAKISAYSSADEIAASIADIFRQMFHNSMTAAQAADAAQEIYSAIHEKGKSLT